MKNSPIYHAEHASTPTLFLMGNSKIGGADPYQTVLNFHKLLKNLGIDTDYVYYPDEGHVFIKDENRKDSLNRTDQWIKEHLTQKSD